jgi:hypothetical protein
MERPRKASMKLLYDAMPAPKLDDVMYYAKYDNSVKIRAIKQGM